ncbi:MAG: peptidylprolyl isomerase [Saprospiraceae bacterium]|nr:peptidylprolyl isomerase [Saprospiraceae bacterium]
MINTRNILSVLLLFCSFSLWAQTGDKKVIDKVVATVGGEIILLSEVQEQYTFAKQQEPNLPAEYQCVALQNLLVQKLLVNQAKLDSVEVGDDEVENQLGARIDRLMLYFNQDQQALEEYYGLSINQIKDQTRNEMRNQMLAERMQAQITEGATVTPAEVQAFFSNIPKDSLPYFNAEVEIREIVYKPKVNDEQKGIARQRITELRQRLSEGEDFAALAKKYSDDPGSGSNGGDLGWQKRGTFVPEFEAVVYNLENGQISPIVETEFGFHVIQLLERRGNLVHARHILIKPEITSADLAAAEAKLDTVRNLLKSNNISFTDAVKKYGDKNTASYNNDGRVANPRSGNTFFEVQDLDTDIYFAIEDLQPGDISEPIPFRGPDGTRMFRLVMLQSRSKPHRADLKLDYNKIQTAALEQKKAEFTEKWVLEKLQSTYLSVDSLYRDCPNIQLLLEETSAGR